MSRPTLGDLLPTYDKGANVFLVVLVIIVALASWLAPLLDGAVHNKDGGTTAVVVQKAPPIAKDPRTITETESDRLILCGREGFTLFNIDGAKFVFVSPVVVFDGKEVETTVAYAQIKHGRTYETAVIRHPVDPIDQAAKILRIRTQPAQLSTLQCPSKTSGKR